jgi:Uma2 family endonuclease
LALALGNQLRGKGCETYLNEMRVKIPSTNNYTYPDVTIVCGEDAELEDDEFDTLLNPILIVEVLSPSTENYDRGKKFQSYRTLASLREYVLVSQDKQQIEHYIRQDDGQWLLSDTTDIDAIVTLPSINCTLKLADVYENINFEAE